MRTLPKLLILLVFILFSIYFFVTLSSIKRNYDSLRQQTKTTTAEQKEQIDDLQTRVSTLSYNLEKSQERLSEHIFFSKNQREYILNGGKFVLRHYGTGGGVLGFDLLIMMPNSVSYDDFGTTSYINFYQEDTIESISINQVGGDVGSEIYKVVIVTGGRYTEGIIYPEYNGYSNLYYRLYEVKSDYRNYKADVLKIDTGYQITVNSDSVEIGSYVLTPKDLGYTVGVLQDANAGK